MRVALVHDWLTGMRGGEHVLDGLLDLFPDAEIFTLVHVPGSVSARIEARPIHVPALGRLGVVGRYYRYGLPLMPALVERFDLRGFDLVLSSSHCVAKGVRPPPGVPHLCYCHTPMRYVWDQYDAYFGPGRASAPVRAAMRVAAPRLRAWDRDSSDRVTRFVANSAHVRDRIRSYYGRDADVVHPPVDIDRFRHAANHDDFYVCLGALVPYKRVDLVIDAFNRLGRPLLVVGEGGERERLEAMAAPNVTFTGRVSDDRVTDLLARSRAAVHAGVEDFGIVLVEAQAAGTPVLAYAAGGALETVVTDRIPGPDDPGDPGGNGARPTMAGSGGNGAPTGVLFDRQTPESLAEGVLRLESLDFAPDTLAANARRFSRERFLAGMRRAVDRVLEDPPR